MVKSFWISAGANYSCNFLDAAGADGFIHAGCRRSITLILDLLEMQDGTVRISKTGTPLR